MPNLHNISCNFAWLILIWLTLLSHIDLEVKHHKTSCLHSENILELDTFYEFAVFFCSGFLFFFHENENNMDFIKSYRNRENLKSVM